MVNRRLKVLFTDGEGPLVFKDLARDVGTRFEDGQFLFDTISLYNAFLAETRGPNSPGDTLSLWTAHILAHGITDGDLYDEAKRTILANGARQYWRLLVANGWEMRVLSTAYRHLWETVSPALGIRLAHVSASNISLENILATFWNLRIQRAVVETEEKILSRKPDVLAAQRAFREGADLRDIFTESEVMRQVGANLDHLYLSELPRLGFEPLRDAPVLNGARKVESAIALCRTLEIGPQDLIYVGDSITDDQMHIFVRENGGLAIAENGDLFALRNATLAIATENAAIKVPLLETYVVNGLGGIQEQSGSLAASPTKEREGYSTSDMRVDILGPSSNLAEIVRVHRLYKEILRGNSLPLF